VERAKLPKFVKCSKYICSHFTYR